MRTLNELLMMISDHGNAFAAKFVNGFGAVSVGAGATLGVVNDTASKLTDPSLWTLQDVSAIVAIFGGLSFAAKSIFEIYYQSRKDRREEAAARKNDDSLTPKN